MLYKLGVNRPMVAGIQTVLKVEVDGFFGEETDAAVRNFQNNTSLVVDGIVGEKTFTLLSPSIDPFYKILEVISVMECDEINDVWAFAKDNKDGYGTNYGAINMNVKGGSVETYKRWYAPKDIVFQSFVKTPAGAIAQMNMFKCIHVKAALDFMKIVGSNDNRFLGVLCDGQVQGGCIYPSRPPRDENWSRWPKGDNWSRFAAFLKDAYSSEYHTVVQAFTHCIKESVNYDITPIQAFAAIHPMSGNAKDYDDQTSRRNLWAYGEGIVHRTRMSLQDYGL